jgi:hypothetical protein
MKRVILPLSFLGVVLGAGCSGGPGTAITGTDLGTQGAPSNTDQAAGNPTQAAGNNQQPAGNADQPSFNSDAPLFSSGGQFDCEFFCDFFRCLIDDRDFRRECLPACTAALPQLNQEACLPELVEALQCLDAAGFDCFALDEGRVNEGQFPQCEGPAKRMTDCVEANQDVDVRVPDRPNTDEFFTCDDGATVIPRDWTCDGMAECEDGTDEMNCG